MGKLMTGVSFAIVLLVALIRYLVSYLSGVHPSYTFEQWTHFFAFLIAVPYAFHAFFVGYDMRQESISAQKPPMLAVIINGLRGGIISAVIMFLMIYNTENPDANGTMGGFQYFWAVTKIVLVILLLLAVIYFIDNTIAKLIEMAGEKVHAVLSYGIAVLALGGSIFLLIQYISLTKTV